MKKYAKAIQSVQEDMGIVTTSFPHLGLYGDSLVLNDKKGHRIFSADHSALKKKQQDYQKWQAENAKKIQEHLQKPDENQFIETYADDKYPFEMVECEETVPELLEPDEEKGQRILTITDDIPFRLNYTKNIQKNAENNSEYI